MKRAKLIPEEVTRIVVSSTMTMPDEDVADQLTIEHAVKSVEQLGCHYLIMRDGEVFTPVADDERGNWFSRYGSTSVVIVIEGGLNEEAQIASNYYAGQLNALKDITEKLSKKYSNAKVTMHHELFLGVNPVLPEGLFDA